MGGKTQQRVAGNVKPSSSGRIRELLTNQQQQQQGFGGIITFSALSKRDKQTKIQTKQQTTDADQEKQTDSPIKQKDVDLKETPAVETDSSLAPSTPSKDNYRLVVKRVGDRDLYVRVKSSDNIQLEGAIKPAVSPSEAGVKKPAYLLDELIEKPPSNHDDIIEQREPAQPDEDSTSAASLIEDDKPREPEELFDFDQLLEKLSETQGLIDAETIDSLNEMNEEQSKHHIYLLKLFSVMLKNYKTELSIEDWDLIVRSLYHWLSLISRAEQPLKESYQGDLCVSVFNFIYQLITFAKALEKHPGNLKDDFPMMQSLLDDWNNFHTSNLFQDILILYFKLIGVDNRDTGNNHQVRPIIESLAQIVVDVDPRMVLSHYSLIDGIGNRIEFDREFVIPPNAIFCDVDGKRLKGFLPACSLLQESNHRVVLVSAHRMLLKTMDNICEVAQASTLISDEEDIDGIPIFPPAGLMSILTSRDSMMQALLSDYRVGDISVTIEPNTDSYTCTLSYLFVWDLIIQFIVGVDKQVGHCIIHSLKRTGAIQRLLDNIFMLLPPLGARDSLDLRIESDLSSDACQHDQPWCISNFLKNPLEMPIKRSFNEIELVALHLYFSVALHMPVTVRKWYNNNSNKRLCNLVNEYTVKHISQVICSLEMESVQKKCQERANKEESRNLVIKARPSAKEVYAVYTRDEFKMELTIKLPLNYPLNPIQIDGGKRVGVTDNKWRSWLLKLTTFLAHQNGPILDGVDLWKKNLDKRFEGVEKCTICFSILHSNYQLPKKKCQTCANMFHNLCLYKWFESSGNSTCPLCRNAW